MVLVNLIATVRKFSPRVNIIDIRGEVTGLAERLLMDAFMQASTGGVSAILINFTGVEYINSSGIGLLVIMLIRAQRQKQRLLAYGLNQHYQEIFDLTRLNEAIGIYRDEADALAAI